MSLGTAKLAAIDNTVRTIFDNRIRAYTPYYRDVCLVKPSTRRKEDLGWVGAMPSVTEWADERTFKELRSADYSVTAKKYQLAIQALRDDIEDDQYGYLQGKTEDVAARAVRHPDKLLVDMLNASESTLCYDGQYLVDTDHSYGDSGSQSNELTYAAATGTDPTADEFQQATYQAIETMAAYKDDQGEFIHGSILDGDMSGYTALVPLAMYKRARVAFGAIQNASGASNVQVYRPPQVKIINGLSSNAAWYLVKTEGNRKPFYFQDRRQWSSVKMVDDPKSQFVEWMADARYAIAPLFWDCIVKTTFT